MTIKRDVYQALLRWKDSPRRKPLILQGARQVGKTYLIKQFGAQAFADMVYINFEEDPLLKRLFRDDLQPERLLRELGIYLKKKIMPNSTLIFFDEIKENKKFIFSAIRQSARAREYESALQWLVAAGLVIKVHAISAPGLPLKAYSNPQVFKLYTLDVGLLGAMSQLDPAILLEGHSRHKKSLQVFAQQYLKDVPISHLSRANPLNLRRDENFVNYPLYFLERFPLQLSRT